MVIMVIMVKTNKTRNREIGVVCALGLVTFIVLLAGSLSLGLSPTALPERGRADPVRQSINQPSASLHIPSTYQKYRIDALTPGRS